MSNLRLVIFDVDGTLVDSAALVATSFSRAYEVLGLQPPPREKALHYVGISLNQIFPLLSPELDSDTHTALAAAYREVYHATRLEMGDAAAAPFFPGARAALDELKAQDWTLLAIATGKAQRGVDAMVAAHGLEGYFQSQQTADGHPSKPHPSMIFTCLAETGVAPERTVMIGDTTYDMDMGRSAGVRTMAVSWGHHPVDKLKADAVVTNFADLLPTIDQLIGPPG